MCESAYQLDPGVETIKKKVIKNHNHYDRKKFMNSIHKLEKI